MTRKRELTKVEIDEIVRLYSTKEICSTHKLAKKYKCGHKKISKILSDNNVKINNKGGQTTNTIEIINRIPRLSDTETHTYIAICKKTKEEIKDFNNDSGGLTKHLLTIYPDINIPSYYERKKYYTKYNRNWYEEYFDMVKIKKKGEILRKCEYCDWATKDIENKSGAFEQHLLKKHNKTLEEYLNEFPDNRKYHKTYESRELKKKRNYHKDKYVICKLCCEPLEFINEHHLKTKHNITTKEYKNRFPTEKIISPKLTKLYRENMIVLNKSNVMNSQYTSKGEEEIKDFISSLSINKVVSNDRKLLNGVEIDILLPDFRLGIEFNGNKWHTEFFGGKDKNYHINKTNSAIEQGYGIIHIFEDEWTHKKEIIKHKLKHLFNKNNNPRIGARKCTIKEINRQTKKIFLSKYHIQGNDRSQIKLGAYYDDILMGVMTFTNNRKMSKHENDTHVYELTRFSTNFNYIIPGLGSKMLKYFIKTYSPTKIISFADRRWTMNENDNLYTKMGFKLTKILKPNYWYFNEKIDRYKRFHKFNYGKTSLKRKYPHLDFNKTETQLMRELGFDRLWDCGLYRFELNL